MSLAFWLLAWDNWKDGKAGEFAGSTLYESVSTWHAKVRMCAGKNQIAWPPRSVCFCIQHICATTMGDGCSGLEFFLLKGERPLRLLISSNFVHNSKLYLWVNTFYVTNFKPKSSKGKEFFCHFYSWNCLTMRGPCHVHMQGSAWGSGAMLNRSHYLCICGWTGLSTGAANFRLCMIEKH